MTKIPASPGDSNIERRPLRMEPCNAANGYCTCCDARVVLTSTVAACHLRPELVLTGQVPPEDEHWRSGSACSNGTTVATDAECFNAVSLAARVTFGATAVAAGDTISQHRGVAELRRTRIRRSGRYTSQCGFYSMLSRPGSQLMMRWFAVNVSTIRSGVVGKQARCPSYSLLYRIVDMKLGTLAEAEALLKGLPQRQQQYAAL